MEKVQTHEQKETQEQYYPVNTWHDAMNTVQEIIKGEHATLGIQYDYPAPYAVFEKGTMTGEGQGFWVWDTELNYLKDRIANVDIIEADKIEK